MPGSRIGSITQWNDAIGSGLITDNAVVGVHVVSASGCSPRLVDALRGSAIPPGTPVQVSFDLLATNDATNVDLP